MGLERYDEAQNALLLAWEEEADTRGREQTAAWLTELCGPLGEEHGAGARRERAGG